MDSAIAIYCNEFIAMDGLQQTAMQIGAFLM